jgi:ABC-type sulfate/molybdate transport systems ATPase subunit
LVVISLPACRFGQAGRRGGTSVLLRDLTRAFGATRALDGLSIEMAPGELVALLGPSGCGKTTALRIVAGFETADTGSVLVDGKDISSVPAARRDMGMVFQSYSLFPNMSALDNVGFGLRMRKAGAGERRKRAGDLLGMVGLAAQAGQYPHQLSGGQQQRVALARALAIEPRVLLLDEPLSALDAKVRLQLREQIRTLQQRLGTTTLFVTHDQEEALSMADRVGVMSNGRSSRSPHRTSCTPTGHRVRGRVRRRDEPDTRRTAGRRSRHRAGQHRRGPGTVSGEELGGRAGPPGGPAAAERRGGRAGAGRVGRGIAARRARPGRPAPGQLMT